MGKDMIVTHEMFGMSIRQNTSNEFFNGTDLVRAGNKWRIENGLPIFDQAAWFQQKNVKEFLTELEKTVGVVKITGRGRGNQTWLHPYLFIDMALAMSPSLKIHIYTWLYDHLKKRDVLRTSNYKNMCGALYVNETNKEYFRKTINTLNLKINDICNIKDLYKADESQLKLRDKIHSNIALLANVVRNNDLAIEYGIKEAVGEI